MKYPTITPIDPFPTDLPEYVRAYGQNLADRAIARDPTHARWWFCACGTIGTTRNENEARRYGTFTSTRSWGRLYEPPGEK